MAKVSATPHRKSEHHHALTKKDADSVARHWRDLNFNVKIIKVSNGFDIRVRKAR